jgi:hypothetical protein
VENLRGGAGKLLIWDRIQVGTGDPWVLARTNPVAKIETFSFQELRLSPRIRCSVFSRELD